MAHYYSLGEVPRKRHTVYRRPDGGLFAEELVSCEGFSDNYSNVYHYHRPTLVLSIEKPYSIAPVIVDNNNMQHRSFQGFNVKPEDDYLQSRKPVLVNSDVYLHLAAPRQSMTNYFFKNSDAHEVIFVHEGTGKLTTMFGELSFSYGDHLVVPRGIPYQMTFDTPNNRLFIVESFTPTKFPKRYLSKYGQLMEHAPFCERDIRKPANLQTHTQLGDYLVKVKKNDHIFGYHYQAHPFDVIGWDGNHYPYALSIHDFEPITGRIHQPPPVHQTFETSSFVMCAFVPRLYDYHPEAIPAPYNHTNVDSDEVLYYVDGDFMSRKHVTRGMITLHPIGITHGPHPGAVEKSIGAKETKELAVMVDTFRALHLTNYAFEIEDKDYFTSWLD